MYKCVQGHFTDKEHDQLEKSIKSIEEGILKHKQYLINPTLKYSKKVWNSFSLSRKDREYDH